MLKDTSRKTYIYKDLTKYKRSRISQQHPIDSKKGKCDKFLKHRNKTRLETLTWPARTCRNKEKQWTWLNSASVKETSRGYLFNFIGYSRHQELKVYVSEKGMTSKGNIRWYQRIARLKSVKSKLTRAIIQLALSGSRCFK